MNEDALKSRAIGLIILCLGTALTYWNYKMRENDGSYYPKLAFLGPLLICMAVDMVIEAPPIPMKKLSIFGWICLAAGIILGLWNAIF